MKLILLTCILFVVLVVMDLAWFKVAGDFLKSQIGSIARLTEHGEWNVRILPAVLVYVAIAVGIIMFVLPISSGISHAFILGALFGCVTYGIYDLTNMATLSAWTLRFALVDMMWGTVLCGTVSSIGYALVHAWFS